MKKHTSSAVTAAALQDHLLRSYAKGLSAQPAPRKDKPLVNYGRAIVRVPRPAKLPTENKQKDLIDKKQQAWTRQLTLAQRLGLIAKPGAPLNLQEWHEVEQRAEHREEHKGKCPICQQQYGQTPSVILSCSHVFHRQCLSSFERFSHSKFCPICRKKSYDKKNYQMTQDYFVHKSATRIQAFYRGYRARQAFEALLTDFPPQHPLVRRKHAGRKLRRIGDRLEKEMRRREDHIERMFREMDSEQEKRREVFMAFNAARGRKEPDRGVDWEGVRRTACARADKECSICLQGLNEQRGTALLSCSHVFHLKCVEAFEYFDINAGHSCPVCRHAYTRVDY